METRVKSVIAWRRTNKCPLAEGTESWKLVVVESRFAVNHLAPRMARLTARIWFPKQFNGGSALPSVVFKKSRWFDAPPCSSVMLREE